MTQLETPAARAGRPAPSLPLPLARLARATLAALTVELSFVPAALPQTLTFGPTGGGGSGVWDTTTPNWFDGTEALPWTQGSSAIFAGTAGTVTLALPITAQDLSFATSGYTITGDGLTLGVGSTPTISLAPGISATISSAVAGSNGLTVDGGGALTLSGSGGTPFYSGTTTVAGGSTLVFASPTVAARVTSTAFRVNGASTLVFNSIAREDLLGGTITFDAVGGGTVDFTGTPDSSGHGVNGGVVLLGGLTIAASGGAQDRVVSTTGIGLNLNFRALTLNTITAASSLLVSSNLHNTGSLTKNGPGTAILTFANEYLGVTAINGGILATPLLANGGVTSGIGMSGNGAGNLVLGGGTLQYTGAAASTDRLFTLTTNSGGLDASGSGALTFTNAGAIALSGSGARSLTLTGSNTGINTLAPVLGESGGPTSLTKSGAGTWLLTGANTYTGATTVTGGRLNVNGDQTAATGLVSVASGATLGGTGTIGGDVVIADGATFAPGNPLSPGTLRINGDLELGGGSLLSYQLGEAGTTGGSLNDLTVVNGDLTLDGTLNVAVTSGGSFDPGIYRLFNYAGALTNNGLVIGSVPTGDYFLQIAVPNQINLVNTAGLVLNFWDGAEPTNRNNGVIDGGDGAWQSSAAVLAHWTTLDGSTNASWTDGAFAIFEGAPGTVTVDDSFGAVVASGMHFTVHGYTIAGEPLALTETNAGTGRTIIRVGDNTSVGAIDTVTIGAVLQGSTRVVKTDLGALIFSGVNTYTGGTAIDGGLLQVANDGNLGAASGALSFNGGTLATTASFGSSRTAMLNAAGGSFDVAAGTTLALSGAIDGAGALTKRNAGTLLLTGANTYGGGTTIAAGALQIGDGGTNGSLPGNVTNHGTLVVNRSDTVVHGGVIAGTGALEQIGAGTTILTGANSYTGATTIAAGTLQLGDGGTSGSLVGNVANNGTLVFNRSDTVVYGGAISGSGALEQIGSGATILAGANSYTGATTIAAGTLQLGDGGTSGSLVGDVTNNGTLVFNRSDTVAYAGVISGSGALRQIGAGTTILTGANTHAGGTAIAGGTLEVTSDGNLGASSGTLSFDGGALAATASFDSARTATLDAGGGTLDVANATTLTLSGAIGGAGALTKLGAGTLVLTGANTFGGGTTIAAGTLRLGDGGSSGSLVGDVRNDGALVIDRSGIAVLAGAISGTGALRQIGAGTTLLQGANTHTGATTIDAGTLVVNGSTTSPVTVGSGATLGGTGTIGNLVSVAGGGTLAPGNSIGTLTVAGDLHLAAGSTYRIETDPSGAADRVDVGARASIDGGTVDVRGGTGTYTRDTTYTILNAAGGITGTFGGVTSDLAFLEASLDYGPNDVLLTLERNDIAFASVSTTSNQRSVGVYLDASASDPGVQPVIERLEGSSADRARAALSGLTGDALSPLTTVALAEGRRFLSQLMGRSQTGAAGTGLAFSGVTMNGTEAIDAPVDRGRGFWVDGGASRGELESDGNASGFDWHAGAITAGFDAQTARGAVLGAALGYGRSSIDVETISESTIDSPRLAFYALTEVGAWQVRGAIGYAEEDIDTRRFIDIGAEPGFAEVSHRGIERSAAVEAEYDFELSNGHLEPLVGFRYLSFDEHGFTESGSNASLTVEEKTSRSEEALLGLRYVRATNAGAGRFEARGIWGHDFGDVTPTVTARIATALSPATFTVAGVPVERDALTLGAGYFNQATSTRAYYADFAVELRGSGQTQYGLLAGLRLQW